MNAPSAVSPLLRRPLARLLFAILCLVPLTKLGAYTKQFLSIDNIPGEVTDKGYEKQIEIMSLSWGAATGTAVTRTGGATTGKVNVSDLNLSKSFDSSSPALLMKLVKGERIPKATLTVVDFSNDHATKVLEIVMTNVLVMSLQASGSEGGGPKVSESLSLNSQSLQFTYTTPDGKELVATVTP